MGMVAYVTAASLAALAVTTAMGADAARSTLALAVGAVLAPVLCIWLGRTLARGRAAAA